MKEISQKELLNKLALLEKENTLLHETNRELNSKIKIFEYIDDVIILFDAKGTYLQMSSPKQNLLYMPIKDIIGKNLSEILPSNEALLFQNAITKSLSEQIKTNISYSLKINNKNTWYDGRLTPLLNNTVLFVGRNITTYKEKELALINSELKHKAIFENTSHAFVLLDISFKIEAFNKQLIVYSEEIFGIKEIGIFIQQIYKNENIKNGIDKAFDNKENSLEVEMAAIKKMVWLEFRFSPVKDSNNSIIAIFISILNINDRKLAEKSLLKSKTNLKAMFDSSQRLYHLIDKDYKVISFNRLTKEFFAKNHATKIYEGLDIRKFISEKRQVEFKENLQRALNGETVTVEGWFVQNKENICWAEYLYIPVFNENNTIMGVAYSILDISEKHNFIQKIEQTNTKLASANEQLLTNNEDLLVKQSIIKNSKETLEKIFAQSPNAIIITDQNAIITDCNEELFELSKNKKRKDIIGKSAFSFIDEKEKKKVINKFNSIHQYGVIKDIEVIISPTENEKIYAEVSMSTIKSGEFGELHYIVILKNVSAKKNALIALKKSEYDLKASNLSKDKFFSIIAHDLKNPFNNIMGFSQLILEDIESYPIEKVREMVAWINESSIQGYNLLENLLNWSRSQTGRLDWNPDLVDLIKLINIESDLLKKTAIRKGINLMIPTEGRKIAFADADMIKTIIRNLVSNALKFTERNGEIQVLVDDVPNSNSVRISVRDTGTGISKEAMEQIFRIDKSTSTIGTDNETGTGLGLILCKEFIEKNGGKLTIESEVGKGSIFSFKLPTSKA